MKNRKSASEKSEGDASGIRLKVLPSGWMECKLGDILDFKYGKSLPDRDRDGKVHPVYGSNGIVGMHSEPLVDGMAIVIGRKGSLGEVHFSPVPCSPIDTTYYVNNLYNQPFRYWYYFLKSLNLKSLNKSTAIPGLNRGDAYKVPIYLPPLTEQKRIADKLDSLLAKVDSCKAQLDRIPGMIKRFRQSVLSAAVSGRLTEDWRKRKGLDKWMEHYLSDLGELSRGKSKHRPRNDPKLFGGSIPFIQTGDVANSNGWIKKHSTNYSQFGLQQSRLFPKDTLCITIAANIADTAILTYPACFPDSIVGFIANNSICNIVFVKFYIETYKDTLERFAPATAQKNINLEILRQIKFTLPTLTEQNEIVTRIEALFSLTDELEKKYKITMQSVNGLTPSIFSKAFRGELVSQDPNDEPAEKLLERIKKEREEQANKKRYIDKKPATNTILSDSIKGAEEFGIPGVTQETKRIGNMNKKHGRPILEILKSSKTPILAKELWQLSDLADDIDAFYAELKKIEEQIVEIKDGLTSKLRLK